MHLPAVVRVILFSLLCVAVHAATTISQQLGQQLVPPLRTVTEIVIDSTNHMGYATFKETQYVIPTHYPHYPTCSDPSDFLFMFQHRPNYVVKYDLTTKKTVGNFNLSLPLGNCATTSTHLVCFNSAVGSGQVLRGMWYERVPS